MPGEAILVVDDNPTNLKLVSFLLSAKGHEVRTATQASEVFAVLKTFSPALILMDVQLPEMDGWEMTRQLKTDPKHSATVIVALTAYAMTGDEQKAYDAGCDGYIQKPINTRTLPDVVAGYLNRARRAEAVTGAK